MLAQGRGAAFEAVLLAALVLTHHILALLLSTCHKQFRGPLLDALANGR